MSYCSTAVRQVYWSAAISSLYLPFIEYCISTSLLGTADISGIVKLLVRDCVECSFKGFLALIRHQLFGLKRHEYSSDSVCKYIIRLLILSE